MPRGGRYRVVPTALWESTEFQQLRPNARYVLVNLMTGSMSSFAGIGLLYLEALQRETGLPVSEIEIALAELEKTPTPASSWIVRDRGCVWVRRQLTSDPAIEKAGGRSTDGQRLSIITHLGSLPQDSLAVKKFRRFHKFTRPSQGGTVPPTEGTTQGTTEGESPALTPALTPTPTNTPALTPDARVREARISDVTVVTGSNHGQSQELELWDPGAAPAEWFNDCPEGRLKRQCVKTEYLERVTLGIQCYAHGKAHAKGAR